MYPRDDRKRGRNVLCIKCTRASDKAKKKKKKRAKTGFSANK